METIHNEQDAFWEIPEDLDEPAPPAKTFYAASTKGFYLSDLHADIPPDAVEIPPDLHQALIDGQAAGKRIMPPDADRSLPWLADPAPPTPEAALTVKQAEIMSGYLAAFTPVEAVYPAAEREGWAIQEAEARALVADPDAETPVLSALVQLRARGETAADLAAKVLANAAQWRMVYAYLTGQQQRMYGEVTALAAQEGITGADIAAYPVTYRMPDGL